MNIHTHAPTRMRALGRLGLAATLGAVLCACGGGDGGMPFAATQAAGSRPAAAMTTPMPATSAQAMPDPGSDAATLMQMGGAP